MNPTHPTPKSRKVKQMLNISTNIANSSTVPRIESLNSTVLEMTDWLERQVEDAIGGKQEHLGCALCFMCNFNSVSVLCVYPHCKVSIGQYTKMCTSLFIFFQLHYFRWQIFEENIWSLSLSLYIWPLESWTIIAIIRFNSILRMIWGRVEC